jgi:glutamine synthetase
MATMKRVAERHNFKVLLHEKPFKGINGSGKHNNWSLGTDTGINLLGPGKTSQENLQFITFIVNVLMAVYKNNALLKASISSANNAHRLGANEAPPAIISVFLGATISKILDELASSEGTSNIAITEKTVEGTFEIEKETEPDILGGFLLEIDFYRWDASLVRQLQEIKENL